MAWLEDQPNQGTYLLEELDGAELKGTFAGNRLKKWIAREKYQETESIGTEENGFREVENEFLSSSEEDNADDNDSGQGSMMDIDDMDVANESEGGSSSAEETLQERPHL